MSSAQTRRPEDVTACGETGGAGRAKVTHAVHGAGDAHRGPFEGGPGQGCTHMTRIAFNPVHARVFVHGISKVCARQGDHQRPVTEALENMVNDVVVQHRNSCTIHGHGFAGHAWGAWEATGPGVGVASSRVRGPDGCVHGHVPYYTRVHICFSRV